MTPILGQHDQVFQIFFASFDPTIIIRKTQWGKYKYKVQSNQRWMKDAVKNVKN